jgi:hypothetical protein
LTFGIILGLGFYFPAQFPEALTAICVIQGSGDTSPYNNKTVTTRGVVYADLDDRTARGFYLQEEKCDSKPETSDGIFVYLGERVDVVSLGDRVEVRGTVQEYYGMTEINVAPGDVDILSTGHALPLPAGLSLPFDEEQARQYLEAREAMYIQMEEAVTVGPTDASGWSWVVDANLGISRVFRDDPRGVGEILCLGDNGLYALDPQVKVGDRISGIRGALDYELGIYCVQLTTPAQVQPASSVGSNRSRDGISGAEEDPVSSDFKITTFNLSNLFDTVDDPNTDDTVLSAAEYQRRLQKRAMALHSTLQEPEIIAVQEVENETVLRALVGRPELEHEYGYIWEDGPDLRGIDVAMLYRKDRVQIYGYEVHQGCTRLEDGLGPDGNGDVKNPVNLITCDTNGDGKNDGNRLFSRPPLMVHTWVCLTDCQDAQFAQGTDVWVIVNHFKSKIEDSRTVEYTLPRRIEQAEFVAGLVNQIQWELPQANLVVAGDLNDFPDSQPLTILLESGLRDAVQGIPYPERYSYLFQGISQVLDYGLFDLQLPLACIAAVPSHINADYPVVFAGVNETVYRSSDHDPLTFQLMILDLELFLPMVQR